MKWRRRFILQEQLAEALWIWPAVAVVVAVFAALYVPELDRMVTWDRLDWSVSATQTVLGIIAGSMITFTGFVLTMILVAVQFASGQMTPRILRATFRHRSLKIALATFIFTFVYALVLLRQFEQDWVPQFSVTLAIAGLGLSLFVFLYLVHRLAQDLRPANTVARIGRLGRSVIGRSYLDGVDQPRGEALGDPTRTVVCRNVAGLVLAVDTDGLVAHARATDSVIVLVPGVGDFVSEDAPLFRVHESGTPVDEDVLQDAVAIGNERTFEQDPRLAFRIIVDIGARALSPGVNDPTSAVVAIDQVHSLLGRVGKKNLMAGDFKDADGTLRLRVFMPNWGDYVGLAISEIRHYGKDSVQVLRRLRAMLRQLIDILPHERRDALQEQLVLIDRAAERNFIDPEDQASAGGTDFQGVGAVRPPGPPPDDV